MSTGNSGAAALVTTLRDAGPVLDSFVAYHRAIGFAHLYLVFDDPADPDLPRARAMSGVTAIAHDDALREAWRALSTWAEYGASTGSEVMSRQILNTEYAMGLARAAGYAWLLHIDSDELFFAPGQTVSQHFAEMSAWPWEAVRYLNCEAIPEREEIGDFFLEVDLFKPDARWAQRNRLVAMREAARTTPQLDPYFHFYNCGKSAVRLAAPGIAPGGVHGFVRPGGGIAEAMAENLFILHYACCGFDAFWRKYRRLGAFADSWWGRQDIATAIGPFHTAARDAVARGEESARAFYRERAAICDPPTVQALMKAGLAVRIDAPRRVIEAARGPA